MGRGFGRGAKSVAIVTHAQVTAKKKTPKGLRGTRQKKRKRYARENDDQTKLEESLGMVKQEKKSTPKSLAQQIASIQVPHLVNKRQKGMKALRKEIMTAVKDLRRRHANKGKKKQGKS